MRILGIDPGSRITGYGVIEWIDGDSRYVDSGCIHATDGDLSDRLRAIFQGVAQTIVEHQPQVLAIESVFVHKNVSSALKLGQARGAAICAAATNDIRVEEYSPKEIKKAVVGKGNADKEQVQYMIRLLLGLKQSPPADAADALAVAICHGTSSLAEQRLRHRQIDSTGSLR